jgi:trehalose 6-phosphate phosphatase
LSARRDEFFAVLGTNPTVPRFKLRDPGFLGENDGLARGHIMTTLPPQNLPRSGEGRQELRVDQLNAPGREGATAGGVAALGDASLALFLDVDGTLLDLAARPDEVVTPAGLVTTLARTERKLAGALALISGRSIDDVDHLFAPLRLRASGVHGAEMRLDPEAPTAATAAAALPPSLLDELRRAVAPFPGVFVEDKRFSFTVHYRLAPSAERPLHEMVKRLLDSSPIAVDVMDAHCAIEIKSPCFDKGGAIATFLSTSTFRGRRPIFVGDDTTDESGFALVSARGGVAYSVGRPRPGAIGSFPAPQDVRGWLADFAQGTSA